MYVRRRWWSSVKSQQGTLALMRYINLRFTYLLKLQTTSGVVSRWSKWNKWSKRTAALFGFPRHFFQVMQIQLF